MADKKHCPGSAAKSKKTTAPPCGKKQATAYHEAGHAVIGWALGLPFRHVTIVPGDDSLGHVLYAPGPMWFQPDVQDWDEIKPYAEARVICSLAGPSAEKRVTGRYNRIGASSDWDNVVDLLIYGRCRYYKYKGRQVQDLRSPEREKQVRVMIKCYWPAISALACVLLKEEMITYRNARKIIIGALSRERMAEATKHMSILKRWRRHGAAEDKRERNARASGR